MIAMQMPDIPAPMIPTDAARDVTDTISARRHPVLAGLVK
jgi:hypothetical protein